MAAGSAGTVVEVEGSDTMSAEKNGKKLKESQVLDIVFLGNGWLSLLPILQDVIRTTFKQSELVKEGEYEINVRQIKREVRSS